MAMQSINPASGQALRTYTECSDQELGKRIEKAMAVFSYWREQRFDQRKKLMLQAAGILRQKKEDHARLMTIEMGKPIGQSRAEIEKCAWVCEYYAEHAERFLGDEVIASDAKKSFVCFEPLGIVLAIMPWNFPFWQVFRFAGPALMAGNGVLLKHASNVPGCSLAIEEVFSEAGFPPEVFQTLLIGAQAAEKLISHPGVRAVTLTGSDSAGRRVAEQCGRHLKKTVLELGGSDPFVVLGDADLDQAVKAAVSSRVINTGQSCIAAKRFIVVREIAGPFESELVRLMAKLKVGDPLQEHNDVGPLAREDLAAELENQVAKSVKAGATLLCGGRRMPGPGYYFEPTVLSQVNKGMPAYEQELFGPVAAVIVADDEQDAVRIANDTVFGLGASIWTRDLEKADKWVREIAAGTVFVNGIVKSDPRLPFGGIKMSGYGRELSHYGIKEFVNIKSVWIT